MSVDNLIFGWTVPLTHAILQILTVTGNKLMQQSPWLLPKLPTSQTKPKSLLNIAIMINQRSLLKVNSNKASVTQTPKRNLEVWGGIWIREEEVTSLGSLPSLLYSILSCVTCGTEVSDLAVVLAVTSPPPIFPQDSCVTRGRPRHISHSVWPDTGYRASFLGSAYITPLFAAPRWTASLARQSLWQKIK